MEEIYLTPEGKKELEARLNYLKSEKRAEVSKKIGIAREFGDLSENAEYDAAKEEQAHVEAEIVEIEHKLRYGKIIITADADVDGSHIRVLFLTFIWKFCPQLIEKGYVYAAVPPLYKATTGTKIQYLKDDAALEAFRKSTTKKFDLGRMKGLGEMDPHEMAETVMNPETRTLKQITMDDVEEVAKTFMSLMGEAVTPRKKFIEDNAWRANIDV